MSEQLTASELRNRLQSVTISDRIYHVAEGDLLISEERFATYAAERFGQKPLPVLEITARGQTAKLLGMGDGNRLIRWAPGVILSYYICKETFLPSEYGDIRTNMNAATQAWMDTCGVQFHHTVELDDDRAARASTNSLFYVTKLDAHGAFIAAAFFPNDPPQRRTLLIDPSYFSPTLRFDTVGVLRHELGHVLGFRHEHIRSGAPPSCPAEELAHTISLTDYDPQSVMHYFCGEVGSLELRITSADCEGARQLYGPPLADFELVTPGPEPHGPTV